MATITNINKSNRFKKCKTPIILITLQALMAGATARDFSSQTTLRQMGSVISKNNSPIITHHKMTIDSR